MQANPLAATPIKILISDKNPDADWQDEIFLNGTQMEKVFKIAPITLWRWRKENGLESQVFGRYRYFSLRKTMEWAEKFGGPELAQRLIDGVGLLWAADFLDKEKASAIGIGRPGDKKSVDLATGKTLFDLKESATRMRLRPGELLTLSELGLVKGMEGQDRRWWFLQEDLDASKKQIREWKKNTRPKKKRKQPAIGSAT